MGVSLNSAQFARKIDRLAKELKDNKGALNAAGMAGKRIFITSAGDVIGAKVAGKRKLIGARYDVKPPTVTVTYTGPAHLVNNPTKPHQILPRRPRGRRRGASALTINGNVRASANHPGTRGKDFFKQARAISVRQLPSVFAKAAITEPLKRIF